MRNITGLCHVLDICFQIRLIYKIQSNLSLEEASLSFTGVVFPYSTHLGRYNLNFHDAEVACLEQGAVVASFEQLYQAWRGGLDWCNAGWLSDGTVRYPITNPRQPCGGSLAAGLRNYGRRNKTSSYFDVFCFTSGYNGAYSLWLVSFC